MTFKAMMFVLGFTEEYGVDVFNLVVALWFFSVGYLLYKRANRALDQYRGTKPVLDAAQPEMACVSGGTYDPTGA